MFEWIDPFAEIERLQEIARDLSPAPYPSPEFLASLRILAQEPHHKTAREILARHGQGPE